MKASPWLVAFPILFSSGLARSEVVDRPYAYLIQGEVFKVDLTRDVDPEKIIMKRIFSYEYLPNKVRLDLRLGSKAFIYVLDFGILIAKEKSNFTLDFTKDCQIHLLSGSIRILTHATKRKRTCILDTPGMEKQNLDRNGLDLGFTYLHFDQRTSVDAYGMPFEYRYVFKNKTLMVKLAPPARSLTTFSNVSKPKFGRSFVIPEKSWFKEVDFRMPGQHLPVALEEVHHYYDQVKSEESRKYFLRSAEFEAVSIDEYVLKLLQSTYLK